MKNILLVFACVMCCIGLNAQESEEKEAGLLRQNFLKINVLSLVGGKISMEYERVLNKKMAVGLAVNLRPKEELPFKSNIMDIIDDAEINALLVGLKTSSTSVTPEMKYYLSKRGYGRGFYIAPYVKYAKFDYATSYVYDFSIDYEGESIYDREETINLKGNLNSLTAGLSFGVNFKLSNSMFLDWKIVGPGYGFSKGNMSGKMELDPVEQIVLREQLGNLKESLNDLPLKFDLDYQVDNKGADINLNKSPWGNIRSGLSIAYKF